MLTIYKASAGSGKTYTLTYEFLKQLLGVKEKGAKNYHLNSDKYTPSGKRRINRHRGILAITFTNAATEEMKSRIILELSKLATGKDAGSSDYVKNMTAEFSCTPDEIQDAAHKALAELLYDYGNFNVSTIDSFFQTVLRTFSREVDHQGDYELSLDTKDTIRQSLSLMLDELNYAKPANAERLFSWIRNYTMAQMSSGKSYNFFHRDGTILNTLANDMAESLNNEIYREYAEKLRAYLNAPHRIEQFGRELNERADNALKPAKETAQRFFDGISAAGYSSELFNATIVSRMKELIRGQKLSSVTGATITNAANGTTPPEKLRVSKNCNNANIDIASLLPYLELMAEFCKSIQNGLALHDFYKEISNSLGILDFYGMAVLKLEEYLRENNTVLISDTGELLKRIISDAEMPFIYERLGMKLNNLLIDEFQDTSHMQWHNLRPLVANSLAEEHDNLIIGDEKQAIYRFRNSDSELLGTIVQTHDFPDNHILRGFSVQDNTNHRSAPGLVKVNNTIFSRLACQYNLPGYANVVQTPWEKYKHQSAYIKISFEEDPNTEAVIEKTAQEIISQHDRGYRWNDILILTRTRNEATKVVEYFSINHPEIALLSSEALLLSSSSAVRTIMSMLKLVEGSYSGKKATDNDDSAPKYASHSDIVMMITRYNYYLSEGYDSPDALKLALDNTAESIGALDEEIKNIRAENPANLVALIEAVILHKVTPDQRKKEYAYIAALQDIATKHIESSEPSLSAFIAAYERNIDRWAVKASGDFDAVEVMTTHKSKGLERDCVHIPFGDWELIHDVQSVWLPMEKLSDFNPTMLPPILKVNASQKSALRSFSVSPFAQIFDDCDRFDLIDNINLCYVAFTRARRELIVYSNIKKLGKSLLETIATTANSEELADSSRIDLAAYFDTDSKVFTFGKPTVKKKEVATKINVKAGIYPVEFRNDTRELISIDDALSEHIDIGGEVDKMICDTLPAKTPANVLEAVQRGNELHAILALTRTVADLHDSVKRIAAKGSLGSDFQQSLYNILNNAIETGGDLVATWFNPDNKIYAERSIFDAKSEDTFRPDRIVIEPNGKTSVIDYKFTTEPRPAHFSQVENYIQLLSRIWKREIKGYLWYPLMNKIITINP